MINLIKNKLQNDLSLFFGVKKHEDKFNDKQKIWNICNYTLEECNTIVLWDISFEEDFLLKEPSINKKKAIKDYLKKIDTSCKFYHLNTNYSSYEIGFYSLDNSSINSLEKNYKNHYYEIYTTLFNDSYYDLIKQIMLKTN